MHFFFLELFNLKTLPKKTRLEEQLRWTNSLRGYVQLIKFGRVDSDARTLPRSRGWSGAVELEIWIISFQNSLKIIEFLLLSLAIRSTTVLYSIVQIVMSRKS